MTATAVRVLRPSRRALNPLDEEAGGSHWHAGGKHWESQDAEEWQALANWVNTTALALDFGFYRDEVEPIFLNRRPGNARCVVCHSAGQCEVDFVGDPAELHPDVIAETGPVDDPVYLCPRTTAPLLSTMAGASAARPRAASTASASLTSRRPAW